MRIKFFLFHSPETIFRIALSKKQNFNIIYCEETKDLTKA